jgi:Ni,Fe-hydrogenase I cytochrome b subunit
MAPKDKADLLHPSLVSFLCFLRVVLNVNSWRTLKWDFFLCVLRCLISSITTYLDAIIYFCVIPCIKQQSAYNRIKPSFSCLEIIMNFTPSLHVLIGHTFRVIIIQKLYWLCIRKLQWSCVYRENNWLSSILPEHIDKIRRAMISVSSY